MADPITILGGGMGPLEAQELADLRRAREAAIAARHDEHTAGIAACTQRLDQLTLRMDTLDASMLEAIGKLNEVIDTLKSKVKPLEPDEPKSDEPKPDEPKPDEPKNEPPKKPGVIERRFRKNII